MCSVGDAGLAGADGEAFLVALAELVAEFLVLDITLL